MLPGGKGNGGGSCPGWRGPHRHCDLQVFVSYGVQSNDSLMQFYGFAEVDNQADVYVLTRLLDWVGQLQPVQQSRLDALDKAGPRCPAKQGLGAEGIDVPCCAVRRPVQPPSTGAAR